MKQVTELNVGDAKEQSPKTLFAMFWKNHYNDIPIFLWPF